MAKTRKSNGRAKAKAEPKFETNGARTQVTHLVSRVQDGIREAGDALRDTSTHAPALSS